MTQNRMKAIRILVVDDHMLVRDGITALLSAVPSFQVAALASNGKECLTLIESVKPDLVLMDVMMPELNGIEATEIITANYVNIKVILLSMEISEEFILKGVKAGAKGYLPKDIRKNELIEAILKVHEGGTYFSSKVSGLLYARLASNRPQLQDKPTDTPLSSRETEVLEQIATGISNQKIADKLFISVKTVDTHRCNILRKLQVKSTAELVKYAIRKKIVSLE